ncbi:MAG: hypothetical protein Q8P18_31965 [Pseudomonadota bacterium]|nr:hypothetical protein [Pseudomonadota bacterium]
MLFLLACSAPSDEAIIKGPQADEEEEDAANDGANRDPNDDTDIDSDTQTDTGTDVPQIGTDIDVPEEPTYEVHTGESDTPTWCRTLMAGRGAVSLIVVDMSTGNWTQEARWTGFEGGDGAGVFHTAGLATDGTSWVFAGKEGDTNTWYSVDAASGSVTTGERAEPLAVGWSGSEWVAIDSTSRLIERFSTFSDLGAGVPAAAVDAEQITRLTVDGTDVYGAWHSDHELPVQDLLTGVVTRWIVLEGWDTYVWGMSVAGGKLHLIDAGGQTPEGETTQYRISSFDRTTGEWRETVRLGNLTGRPSGLWCTTAP